MQNQALEDINVLKEIINNKIELRNIDIETKKRLILLCKQREQQIREKIDTYKLNLK